MVKIRLHVSATPDQNVMMRGFFLCCTSACVDVDRPFAEVDLSGGVEI